MKVATHNGIFHADDVFAISVLHLFCGDNSVLPNLVRSRDPETLAKADIRVDVGGKYNPNTGDFDHHQKGGAGVRENGVPYASFGLVWKEYGPKICGQDIADIVERRLVMPIDAADNGYALTTPNNPDVLPYNVSSLISSFNPCWNEERDVLFGFQDAFEVALSVLEREIARAKGEVGAKSIVMEALSRAENQILILDKFCPWQDTVCEHGKEILYVIFPSETGDWRIQGVPEEKGSFKTKKALPESWAGKSGAELGTIVGITDAVFCHNGRFIAGAKSKDGVLKMAKIALE